MEPSVSSSLDRGEHMLLSRLQNMGISERKELFKQILSSEVVNMRNLRRYGLRSRRLGSMYSNWYNVYCIRNEILGCSCSSWGVPEQQGLRSRTWQLLLGYIPKQRSTWAEMLARRRKEYTLFCEDFSIRPSEKVSFDFFLCPRSENLRCYSPLIPCSQFLLSRPVLRILNVVQPCYVKCVILRRWQCPLCLGVSPSFLQFLLWLTYVNLGAGVDPWWRPSSQQWRW